MAEATNSKDLRYWMLTWVRPDLGVSNQKSAAVGTVADNKVY